MSQHSFDIDTQRPRPQCGLYLEVVKVQNCHPRTLLCLEGGSEPFTLYDFVFLSVFVAVVVVLWLALRR